MKKTPKKKKGFFNLKLFYNVIFWGYNSVYLLALIFIFSISFNGFFLFSAQNIPWNLAIMVYLIILMPIFAICLGLFTKLKKEPQKLATFLFTVEVPIIVLAFFRIALIRQVTPILWLLLIGAIISMVGITIMLLKEKFSSKIKQLLLFLSQETALILQVYGSLLAIFFLPVIIAGILRVLFSMDFIYLFNLLIATKGIAFFTFLFSVLLFTLSIGFFIITPIVAVILYFKSFRQTQKDLKKLLPADQTKIILYGYFILFVGTSLILSFQSGDTIYTKQIEDIKNATTYEEQQASIQDLMKDENSMKNNLTTKYLSKYKYLADNKNGLVFGGYKRGLGLPEGSAMAFQGLFNSIATPFIYKGEFDLDTLNAEKYYAELFDAHIQDGQREEIINTLKATNTTDQMKAGLLDKESKTVHTVYRKIEAETFDDGLLAKVSFEEEYENKSDDMQEVYYEFSLPEDAVITGLWLGPDLEEEGIISPKGAARKVYERQVPRRVDPALLEQIGPRQYKLRVFPIPAPAGSNQFISLRGRNQNQEEEQKNQRVKFEYNVLTSKDGIALPQIHQTRNVYSTNATNFSYSLNGNETNAENSYIASTLPASGCFTEVYYDQDKIIDTIANIYFIPHSANPKLQNTYDCNGNYFDPDQHLTGLKLALLVDTSYSNHSLKLARYLQETFKVDKVLENNEIDLYYFGTKLSEKVQLDENYQTLAPTYFGKTDRLNALESVPENYDAIFMITDDSDFDAEKEDHTPKIHNQPIYMIHWTGTLPAYSDQLTKSVIQSKGGTYTDPIKALNHIWLTKTLKVPATIETATDPSTAKTLKIGEHGSWLVFNPAEDNPEPSNIQSTELGQLASSNYIKDLIVAVDINDVGSLNFIHQIARNESIITPYSSLIALVTDWQRKQLKQAEDQEDRFDTTFDSGVERLSDPSGRGLLNISSVPEPEEWALIILGVILLSYFYRRDILKWATKKVKIN